MHPHYPLRSAPRRQQGASLVIVLLFLLALTGLTIWAARQSLLGEGIARNQQDLQVARQAAEAALRDAERDIVNVNYSGVLSNASCSRGYYVPEATGRFDTNCTAGLCIRTDNYANSDWSQAAEGSTDHSEPWWPKGKGGLWNDTVANKPGRVPVSTANCSTFTGAVPVGTYTGAPIIRGVAKQPEYILEFFKRNQIGGKTVNLYRITARGFGYTNRTQVVLQSVFIPE
nr:PilX N-terminal domain-containing pilus assembly protein [uncultured Albidiferax sp.]